MPPSPENEQPDYNFTTEQEVPEPEEAAHELPKKFEVIEGGAGRKKSVEEMGQAELLELSIKTLSRDLEQLDSDQDLLRDVERLAHLSRELRRQIELNAKLLDNFAKRNKAEKQLSEIGGQKNSRLMKWWSGQELQYPKKYESAKNYMESLEQEKAGLWEQRKDAEGKVLGIREMQKELKELRQAIKERTNNLLIGGVAFNQAVEELGSEASKITERRKEIEHQLKSLREQLAILKATENS